MSWRKDRFHKLIYVQRGRVNLHLRNGQKIQVRPGLAGAVFVVSSGAEHRIVDAVPSVILLLCIGEGWLKRIAGLAEVWADVTARSAGGFTLEGAAADEGERKWRRALLEQGRGRTDSGVLRDALALQLLVALGRQPERGTDEVAEERVARVTQEINVTFFERWTVDAAAERSGMSRRHFTACFRRINQCSLVEHLNDRRLDQVEKLLESGRHTITGAVFSSGFEDLAHFYRLFKRRHAKTPGTWIESRRTKGGGRGTG